MVYRCNKCGKELVIVGNESAYKIIDGYIIEHHQRGDTDKKIYILQCEKHGRVFITENYYIDGLAVDINDLKKLQKGYDRDSVNLFMDCDGSEIYTSDKENDINQKILLLGALLFLISAMYGFVIFVKDVYDLIF